MNDPNYELQDGLLRAAGFLAVFHTLPLPKLEQVTITPDGGVLLLCSNRADVHAIADTLGLDRPAQRFVYEAEATYAINEHGWYVSCNERPPYEPMPGDVETAENTTPGATS